MSVRSTSIYSQFCLEVVSLYDYTSESFKYPAVVIMIMQKKKSLAKIPYEGYTLPKSSEKGESFIDFNKVINRKVVKVKRKKRNANILTNK
jgi:midasin (ATPase involved in ribosome maturation)